MYVPFVQPGDFPRVSEEDALRMDAESFIIEHTAELQEVQYDPDSLSFFREVRQLRGADSLSYEDKLKCKIYEILSQGR